MLSKIKKYLQELSDLRRNDPVRHCQVYREVGCAHVDGMDCDMKTCQITVNVKFMPRSAVIVERS